MVLLKATAHGRAWWLRVLVCVRSRQRHSYSRSQSRSEQHQRRSEQHQRPNQGCKLTQAQQSLSHCREEREAHKAVEICSSGVFISCACSTWRVLCPQVVLHDACELGPSTMQLHEARHAVDAVRAVLHGHGQASRGVPHGIVVNAFLLQRHFHFPAVPRWKLLCWQQSSGLCTS